MTLEQRVAQLEAVIGDFMAPANLAVRPPEIADMVPGSTLREYPVMFRQRQLGVGTDDAVRMVSEHEGRITALELAPSPSVQPAEPSNTLEYLFVKKLDIGAVRPFDFDGAVYLGGQNSVAMYLQSDLSNTDPQREGNSPDAFHHPTAPHTAAISLSRDAGFRQFQNVAYLADGTAFIPDPSRYGIVCGMDSEGMMSINILVPNDQPGPDGLYRVKATHKGQVLVFLPDMNGDVTIRLPQGGHLYEERGDGRMGANPTGHRDVMSRKRVVTEGNYPPARGGLHG